MPERSGNSDFRSYEVYQRERVGETTNLVNPRELISDDYLRDPFTIPGVLRENYPCYRDWVGNRFWVTRYDDVTSIFTDDANFETRPVGAAYSASIDGADLSQEPEVRKALADRLDSGSAAAIAATVDALSPSSDLAVDFADRFAESLVGDAIGIDPGVETNEFFRLVRATKDGVGWDERKRIAGVAAYLQLCERIEPLLAARRAVPAEQKTC